MERIHGIEKIECRRIAATLIVIALEFKLLINKFTGSDSFNKSNFIVNIHSMNG